MHQDYLSRFPEFDDHARVVRFEDPETGLKGFFALHTVVRGKAVGGTRMYPWATEEDALRDALRLSRAMSFKCALSGMRYGGAKSVIIGDPATAKTPALLRSYARALAALQGTFYTGEDVGMTQEDIDYLLSYCPYFNGSSRVAGDPSAYAAKSTFEAIKASLRHTRGDSRVRGRTIAVKGVGKVGSALVEYALREGARVVIADINVSAVEALRIRFPNVEVVSPTVIHTVPADVYAPCALGLEFTVESAGQVAARIVCGAANNQLADGAAGDTLFKRGIVYVPDFIVNAGGLINVVDELEPGGYSRDRVTSRIAAVGAHVEALLARSTASRTAPFRLAYEEGQNIIDAWAEDRVEGSLSNDREQEKSITAPAQNASVNAQPLKKTDSNALPITRVLALFQAAARRVPAYRDFLHKHGIRPEKITTWQDFLLVPTTDKKTYLRQYDLPDLCWDGKLGSRQLVFTATSGSTGEPFYFPRGEGLDRRCSAILESFLRYSSHGTRGPVLVIVCFGMGVWIGGLITYRGFALAGKRSGIPLSILTPGPNKAEVIMALKKIAPLYEQVILAGYPPFLKDVLDAAIKEGVSLSSFRLRLHFAAEGFSDAFRGYLCDKAGIVNECLDTMSIYGSADVGSMAFETPFAIAARRLSSHAPDLFRALFHAEHKIPTLAQYDPRLVFFEALNHELHLTSQSALPLIRYAIGDRGGVLEFPAVHSIFRREGFDPDAFLQRLGIAAAPEALPFVYVYERSDFSTKLYGAIIYAEHVRAALEEPGCAMHVTGRCTLATEHDAEQNEFLRVFVELREGEVPLDAVRGEVKESVCRNLLEKNAEYRDQVQHGNRRMEPVIDLVPYASAPYFSGNGKQLWIKK